MFTFVQSSLFDMTEPYSFISPLFLSSSSKNDIYVRLTVINFLSTLKLGDPDHKTLAMAVLREAWGRYFSLAQISTFRQFTNSLPHRQKHRLVQLFPLLDQFIDQVCCFVSQFGIVR